MNYILVAGFPDAVNALRNFNWIWLEGVINRLNFAFDFPAIKFYASTHLGANGAFIVMVTAVVDMINIDADAVAKVLVGGSSKRFSLALSVAVSVAN